MEVGGGLAVRGRRPRQHSLLRAVDHRRAAGALDRRRARGGHRVRPRRYAPARHDHHRRTRRRAAGRQRRVDQHRHVGGVRGQRRHGRGAIARRDDHRRRGRRPHRASPHSGASASRRHPLLRRHAGAAAGGRHRARRRSRGGCAGASGARPGARLALGRPVRGRGRQPGATHRGDGRPHGGGRRERRPHRRASARGLSRAGDHHLARG